MSAGLKKTPFYPCHVEAGARLVEFAGWEMPVQYSGVIEEHRAVRSAAGLFDVSHMGEIRVRGSGAQDLLQLLTPNDVSKLKPGRAHYTGFLTEKGTYIDDLLLYRLEEEEFLLVVNAANSDKDFTWISSHAPGEVEVEDVSGDYALVALQGPQAEAVLSSLTAASLSEIRYYRFVGGEVDGCRATISRTGYTGEDGFEVFLRPDDGPRVWRSLLQVGGESGLVPAGLGARDTLRLEAGMALYGHEIDESTTPFEAGLDWVVKLDKGEFIGRQALVAQREEGLRRRLAGFRVEGKGIARSGHRVLRDGEGVGEVVSGTWSPTFEQALGTAYVPVEMAEPDTPLVLEIRGRHVEARAVELPFYRRGG